MGVAGHEVMRRALRQHRLVPGADRGSQRAAGSGQRVWKRQPGGGSMGFGGSPVSAGSSVRLSGSIDGIEDSSARE